MARSGKLKWIICAAVLCCNFVGAPLLSGKDIHVSADWDVGESRNYQVIASSTEVFITESVSTISYDIAVTVLGRSESGSLLEWFYSNVIREGDASFRPVTCVVGGLRIRYNVDEFGALREIVNWEEISAFFETNASPLMAPGRDRYSAYQFEQLGQISCPFADKDEMEKTGIEDIKLFHSLYGFGHVEPFENGANVWNPLYEEPFIVSLEATAADYYVWEDQGHLTVEHDFNVDTDSPVHIGLQWVFNYDLASTWPQSAYMEIESVSLGARQDETLLIRQSD